MRALVLTLSLSMAVAACGEPAPPGAGTGDGDGQTVYTTTAMVLEADDGPQLCLGAIADSLPPQCGGPLLVGWDWDAVEGEESQSGVRWGSYRLVGTYDGERFTLTEPARSPSPPEPPASDEADRFLTPCPPPPGGWRPSDPERATEEHLQAATGYARAQAAFAGLWVDQSPNPASRADTPDSAAMNDPALLVLNARFTGDLARHEAALREHFGGALCVSEARHTLAELEAIRDELTEEFEVLHASVDEVRGVVQFGVITADPDLQHRLDERYGDGVVEFEAALRPVDQPAGD